MEPEIIKFEDIIKGCLRKWKEIIAFGIFTAILAAFVVLSLDNTTKYEGIFKIFVKSESYIDASGNISKRDENIIQNYIELIRTRNFVENSLERTDLDISSQQVLPYLSLLNLDKSDFIQVKYTSNNKNQTEKVLKAIQEEVINKAVGYNNEAEVSIEEDIFISEIRDIKNSKLLIILGFVGGIGMALVLAFILECINKEFKTKGELERELNIPVIANIPRTKASKSLIISNEAADLVIIEAYNSLAADIKFGNSNKNLKSIAITSSLEGEGSTTTAINLAFALSNSNKTLLIDGDLKKPSIAKALELTNTKGLIDVISKKSKLGESVCSVNGNLDVLVSGKDIENSISLIDSKEFDELISELNKNYDYIIIDTPPLQAVADTKVLSKKADGVVLVVKAESTKKDIVKTSVDDINNLGSRLIGLVFNYGDRFRNKYYEYKK